MRAYEAVDTPVRGAPHPAADHAVLRAVIDEVDRGVPVPHPPLMLPGSSDSIGPTGMHPVLHGPQRGGRDGVFRLAFFQRGGRRRIGHHSARCRYLPVRAPIPPRSPRRPRSRWLVPSRRGSRPEGDPDPPSPETGPSPYSGPRELMPEVWHAPDAKASLRPDLTPLGRVRRGVRSRRVVTPNIKAPSATSKPSPYGHTKPPGDWARYPKNLWS